MRTSKSPFKFIQTPVTALARVKDAMNDIYERRLDVLIVKGVFPPALMKRVVARLEQPGAAYEWTLQEDGDPSHKQFYLLGESLTPYAQHPDGPDLDHYFDTATRFRKECRALFGKADYEARIEQVFRKLSGGRPVKIPPAPGRRSYTPATIRALPAGCEIPVHVGNYFTGTPAYRHLQTLVTLEDQLSYFVVMQKPEKGGDLVVYTLEYPDDAAPPQTREARAGWDDSDAGDAWDSAPFSPGVGDLLLFDGGRYYHRVSRVAGKETRWTIGGFIGFAQGGRKSVYYWS